MARPVEPPTFRLFIAGEWVDSTSGRDVREPQPGRHARRRSAGSRQGTAADVARAVRAAETRRPAVAADAGPEARRDPVSLRRAHGRAQGAPRAGDDPRDGQGPGRGARRRPGRHRHRLPDGRRGPPDVRRHDALRAARQVGDEHPPADRRRRDHHALELPDGDPVLEDDARPRHRQHRRLQAVERHAALRDAPRRADGRGRLPAGHRQPRDRRRRRGRRRDRREPGRRGHLFTGNTETGRRIADRAAPPAQARLAGARRQERRSSSWPTPTSTSRPTASSGRPSGRPASAARPRSRVIVERAVARAAARAPRGARPRRSASATGLDPTTDVGPLINAGARRRSRATSTSAGARASSSSAAARPPAADLAARPLLRADDLRRRPADGPDRPRRRSSGRSCRSSRSTTTRRPSRPSTRPATASRRASSPAT